MPHGLSSWRERGLVVAAWAAVSLLVVGMLVPVYPLVLPVADVETSWRAVLGWAFVRGLVFGKDIVWTYGPWGFAINDHYVPGAWGAAVMAQLVVVGAMLVAWGAAWRRAREAYAESIDPVASFEPRSRWRELSDLFASLTALAAGILIRRNTAFDPLFFVLPVLMLVLWRLPRRPGWLGVDWVRSYLVVAMGLASLMKFTALPVALLAVGVNAASGKSWRLAAGYLASLLFWWAVAGQPIGAMGIWLWRSIQVAGGYSDAMALPGRDALLPAGYALGAMLLLLGLGIGSGRSRWAGLAATGVVLWIGFKASFVREDFTHGVIGGTTLAVIGMAVLPLCWSRAGQRRGWLPAGLLAGAVGVGLTLCGINDVREGRALGTLGLARNYSAVAVGRYQDLWAYQRDPERLQRDYARACSQIQVFSPLPEVEGSVDLYGAGQRMVLMKGLDYKPRPIFQSYSAYTPALSEINAASLRAGEGVQNVLVTVGGMPGWFPTLEDSRSWREMLGRFVPDEIVGTTLSLRRIVDGRPVEMEPLAETQLRCGEWIDVPNPSADGPVWIEVRMRRSVWGQLRNLLWKSPAPEMEVESEGGTETFAIPKGMGEAGFLLSPMVRNVVELRRLFVAPAEGPRVRRVRFLAANGFESEVSVRFYRLRHTQQAR